MSGVSTQGTPVRMAMLGGGPGAFIGPVHAMSSQLDGRVSLVAGAFSSDPDRAAAAGRAFGIAPDRSYADWRDLIRVESARSDGAELIAIVTPNHLHHPMALAALEAGFHIVSDKPAAATLPQAIEIEDAVRRSGKLYALTFTYTGYPMIRMARRLVADGAIGDVRKVVVQYSQGWLAEAEETQGNRQAAWRTDPASAGIGGCISDIGVHAFQLVEYVSGRAVSEIVADLSRIVATRSLDDDCNILLRLTGGVPGVLIASQIATGERNNLILKIHGSKATLGWSHEEAALLRIEHLSQRTEILHAGTGLSPDSRLPAGHPEGFIEAFATIYADVAAAIRSGGTTLPEQLPGIADGVRSMRFVERAVTTSGAHAGWTSLAE